MNWQNELYNGLPEELQEKADKEGRGPEAVMGYTCDYIDQLTTEIERLQDGQKTAATQLEIDYARAVRVLSSVSTTVINNADADEDLDFQCNQGSEEREFDHGCYCGRTSFANHLLYILKDKKNE